MSAQSVSTLNHRSGRRLETDSTAQIQVKGREERERKELRVERNYTPLTNLTNNRELSSAILGSIPTDFTALDLSSASRAASAGSGTVYSWLSVL